MAFHRAFTFGTAVSAALLFAGVAAMAQPVAPGPAGAAFYTPPQPLPKGPRGSVIWTRSFDGTMALPSAARTELVLYRSTDAQGRIVPVTGTVSIPKGDAPKGGWPVITWAHGTTGLAPACAPSLDDANGPEHPYIVIIRTLLDGFVAKGYAVAASDYQGLGVAGFQPFLQGVPTGRNTLDMLRAARGIEPKIGKRYAVMGHSQGGHVDLFAAAQGPAYVPEFKLLGNVAFAPGSQIAGRLAAVMKSDKVELSLPYVLYVLQSYATNHPAIDLKRILTPQAIAQLPVLMDGCMTKALTVGYWSTAIAKDQFVAKPDLAAFLRVAAQNEPGALRIAAPTMVVQGKADVTVFPKDTDTTVRALCAKGNAIDYMPVAGADHNGSMKLGAQAARDFIDARFAAKKATSNCKALPKAGE
ncbi:MAG: lipase family protein [Pseudolabrys sp.]|nr:lipase family protein [Pseudolabrys sp.]MDP2295119.1 lipase family protein [Pseudolabrys sp.]